METENERDITMGLPTGSIIAFAGKSIPTGWELCDGREVSKTERKYSSLFNAIENIWGGNGNPNFKLPDLRSVFLRGAETTNAVGHTGGKESHAHSGITTIPTSGGAYGVRDGGANPPGATGTDHIHNIQSDSQSHLPPFVEVVYLIKL